MTATASLRALCFVLAISLAWSDCYMHNPRGSNNRLQEKSANRNNANRLFDSQNNNRGGYNVGEMDVEGSKISEEKEIYNMRYFQSGPTAPTYLTIEWTNQHGCGGDEDNDPNKLNCNLVIQYMVSDDCDPDADLECLRNGVETNTQKFAEGDLPNKNNIYAETPTEYADRRTIAQDRGLHESYDYYNDCYMRRRNEGLFTADQNLRNNKYDNSSAIHTRQNNNGNRRGYECPEERDYYPYWHPTPWRDIAILADNASQCSYYLSQSFNVQERGICRQKYEGLNQYRDWSYWNNEADCEIHGGTWFTEYSYIDVLEGVTNEDTCDSQNNNGDGLRYVWKPKKIGEDSSCLVLPGPPECRAADWSRVNHLGNGREGVPLNYTWRLPYFPSNKMKRIVVRIRYNISTDDYDPFNTNASYNNNPGSGIFSPVQQNPNVNIGASSNKPLRLAINTAQFGRTFQDRSHVLRMLPRSDSSGNDNLVDPTCSIYNLNVRGKRGNIVQTYPSVEYDFIPNRMTVSSSDCIHIQWTGSNRHNNGNPAGDGQAGDAGEGTSGTDRNNMVQTPGSDGNYPLPWEQVTMWKGVELIWKDDTWTNNSALTEVDIGLAFATSGFYHCNESSRCDESLETKGERLNRLLNNASPSFGAVVRFRPGTYHYINSRNNNFTNRSQKGTLTVMASS